MIWLIGNRGMLGTEVESLLAHKGLSYLATDIEVDISDNDSIDSYISEKREERIEWIINCSGYTAVDLAEDESNLAFSINADGVLNIAKAAKRLNAVLIHISTDYVFNGRKDTEYTEEDSPDPQNIYAKSKYMGDSYVADTLKKYYIIRTSWLYGKNGKNFVYTMLRLFKERDYFGVVSNQWGSPTYAKDLAKTILVILESKKADYGIYNFSNEGKTNWYEYAKEIYAAAKRRGLVNKVIDIMPISSDEYPAKAKRPSNSYLSKEKIRDAFAISVRKWQDALMDIIEELVSLEKYPPIL